MRGVPHREWYLRIDDKGYGKIRSFFFNHDPLYYEPTSGEDEGRISRKWLKFEGKIAPRCYSKDTELLTQKGWKLFKDISKKDKIATLTRKGHLTFQLPLNIFEYDYSGQMINFKNRYLDLLVTPNHSLYTKKRPVFHNQKWNFIEAKEVLDWNEVKFKRGFKYQKKFVRKRDLVKYGMPLKEFLYLFGFYLAEGCLSKFSNNYKPNPKTYWKIHLANKDPRIIDKVISLLRKNHYSPYYNKSSGNIQVYIPKMIKFLKRFGKAKDKFIPGWMKELPQELLKSLWQGLYDGDGFKTGFAYGTLSEQLAEDFLDISLKLGLTGFISESGNMFIVYLQKYRNDVTKVYKENSRVVPYEGKVYCVEIPNHVLFVKRKGKPCWSGNSKYNPNKRIPAHMKIIDKGTVEIKTEIEEGMEIINFKFKGKKLKGKWRLVQEEKRAPTYTFEKLSMELVGLNFVLQKHWIPLKPKSKFPKDYGYHFDIRFDSGLEFNLFKDPLKIETEEEIKTKRKKCKEIKTWMGIKKEHTFMKVGYLHTYVDPIDSGKAEIYELTPDFISMKFFGKKLKGYWVYRKKATGEQVFLKSRLPKAKSSWELSTGDPSTGDYFQPFQIEKKKGWDYFWVYIYSSGHFTRCVGNPEKYIPKLKNKPPEILEVLVCLYRRPGTIHGARVASIKVSNKWTSDQAVSWIKKEKLHTWEGELIRKKQKEGGNLIYSPLNNYLIEDDFIERSDWN